MVFGRLASPLCWIHQELSCPIGEGKPNSFYKKKIHNSDSTNCIYVNIRVEKTFKALHCQMCGKYFKKKQRITEHLQIKLNLFFGFPVKDIKISDRFCFNTKLPRNTMGFINHNLSHKTLKHRALTKKQYHLAPVTCQGRTKSFYNC